jgi:LysM repeat protein
MDETIEARNEYIKFFLLLAFFGALTIGAAMLRPLILGGGQSPQPLKSPTAVTLPSQSMATISSQAMETLTAVPLAKPTSLPSPVPTLVIIPTATAEPLTYLVQPGDNLFRIGQQYGLTVDELMRANGLTDRHRIQIGQVLTVPEPGATLTSTSYVVQWGDTLWGISRAFGIKMDVLAAVNEISDPAKIMVGQVLDIPR